MSTIPQSLDPAIVDHFEDPYHQGDCEAATHQAEGRNTLCGDAVCIQLRVDLESGVIVEAWFDGEGCVVSQAAASMLVERVEQMNHADVHAFDARSMLELLGPTIAPSQQKCGLLPWRVLQLALGTPTPEFDDAAPTFGGPHLGEEN